jgi:hypothetical protein
MPTLHSSTDRSSMGCTSAMHSSGSKYAHLFVGFVIQFLTLYYHIILQRMLYVHASDSGTV